MDITVSEKYLWFPVDMSGEMVWVSVYDGDQKIQEMKVSLGKEHIDFYGVWKATEYLGKELRIVSEKGEEYLDGVDIRQEKTRPQNDYPYRPRLHYTPAYGWVNDPNGLVYVDGVYHMFHQYNPYSTEWQNMSWGHATSTDLLHWTRLPVAMLPDEEGTIFSGCGLTNEHRDEIQAAADSNLFPRMHSCSSIPQPAAAMTAPAAREKTTPSTQHTAPIMVSLCRSFREQLFRFSKQTTVTPRFTGTKNPKHLSCPFT